MEWRSFWDFLFPPYCVSCARDGEWWCADCRSKVEKVRALVCPRCLKQGEHACQEIFPLSAIKALGYYHDPYLRAVITNLKFNGTRIVMGEIEKFILARKLELDEWQLAHDTVLVPIPLSESRHRSRGFNQAELIAQAFQKSVWPEMRIQPVLAKVKNPDPQSSLGDDVILRQKNIQDCFQVIDDVPAHVVLVDDVITTGATTAEAARLLLTNGAQEVRVLALALGA